MKGDLTIIRAVEKTDIPFFNQWKNDPHFTKLALALVIMPESTEQTQDWLEAAKRNPYQEILTITTLDEKPIGLAALHNIDRRNQTCRFGTGLYDTSFRGKGLGTDARKAILQHLFFELNFRRVYGGFLNDNVASQRSHEKLGAKMIGKEARLYYHSGQYHTLTTYQYDREKFLKIDSLVKEEQHG